MTALKRHLHFFLLAAATLAALAPAARAENLPQLSRFVWSEEGSGLSFSIQMSSGARAPKLTNEVEQKRYFYVDFPACGGPAEEKQWPIDSPLISGVRRIYYPGVKVLRLIFFTKSNKPLNVTTQGLGTEFTVKAVPLAGSPALAGIMAGKPGTKKIIVIDAGHGGRDSGAKASRSIGGHLYQEKEITLQLAQRLAALIRKTPNLDCVLTRSTDDYVGLDERIRLAEAAKGDLFISLHLNATDARSKTPRGFEIYFLGDSNLAVNKHIEAMENEDAANTRIDPAKHDASIPVRIDLLNEMAQTRRQESMRFSSLLDDTFRKQGPFTDHMRGVKGAGFRVLKNFGMPAVLIETGFIDNPQDAAIISDPGGQQQVATLIVNAVNRYFAQADPKFKPKDIALESPAPRPQPAPALPSAKSSISASPTTSSTSKPAGKTATTKKAQSSSAKTTPRTASRKK